MLWWGYIHENGTIQVKRYFDENCELSIQDAEESPFVKRVFRPFDVEDRQEAIEVIKGYCNPVQNAIELDQ